MTRTVRPLAQLARRGVCSARPKQTISIASSFRPVRAIARVQTAASVWAPSGTRRRFVSSTSVRSKGILPETDEPSSPKQQQPQTPSVVASPAEITEEEYHKLADVYLDKMLASLEQLQDAREDVDVEYAAGVLTVSFGDKGTYVINKQPPNKQIWLSSPTSGPKRYDWVVLGDGMNDKQGTGAGNWIYLRDQSSLNDLFREETGVDLSMPIALYGE